MSERTPWPWPLTALAFVGSLVLLLVLGRIPIPGVDAESLPQTGGASVLLDASATLVIVRGLASLLAAIAPETETIGRKIAAMLFFTIVGVQAWGVAVGLEALQSSYYAIVPTPGRQFEVLAVASMVGVQGIVWVLADLIGRSGRLHGASAIYGIFVWFWLIRAVGSTGESIAEGYSPPWFGAVMLGLVVPMLVGLVGALIMPNGKWPLRLPGGVEVRSGLDVALVGVALGSLVSVPFELGAAQLARQIGLFPRPPVTPIVATFVVIVVLAAYATVREEGPREWRLVVPTLLLPLMAMGALLRAFFAHGGARLFAPGPYDGDADLHIQLDSPTHGGSHDATVLQQRLDALGVQAIVHASGPDHLDVHLHDVKGSDEILEAVLPSRQLALRMVSPGQPDQGYPDPAAVPPGFAGVLATQCEEGRHCITWILDDPPTLTNADVADAQVQFSQYNQQPIVMLTFTPAGQQRFAAATQAHVGEKLAIVVDDNVISVPVIREAITGGKASIEMGAAHQAHALEEAQALAAAMVSGSLYGRWQVASIDAGPEA